jgi:hypothetical protein
VTTPSGHPPLAPWAPGLAPAWPPLLVSDNSRRIMGALAELTRTSRGDPMRERACARELLAATGISTGPFYSALGRLRCARYVEWVARGEYRLTPTGWVLTERESNRRLVP